MKIFTLSLFVLAMLNTQCQNSSYRINDISPDSVSTGVLYKGKFIDGKNWFDKNGENYLIVSRIGPQLLKDQNMQAWSAVFVVNWYVKQNNTFKLNSTYSDSTMDIALIPTWVALLPNSITITDLDSNGINEISMFFCHNYSSGLDAKKMKFVFNDGIKTRILNGYMYEAGVFRNGNTEDTTDLNKFEFNLQKVTISKSINHSEEYDLHLREIGRYQDEDDFATAPMVFLQFARKKWAENVNNHEYENNLYFKESDFSK